MYFYPRSPCGERHNRPGLFFNTFPDFYPRSPCGERQHAYQLVLWVLRFLSTLSLRRATLVRMLNSPHSKVFLSTLSLRRATEKVPAEVFYMAFLSTLSLRRATCSVDIINDIINDFYPRSPCGERLSALAPEENPTQFLSTLSLRRATSCQQRSHQE